MNLRALTPAEHLNTSFRRQKIARPQLDTFKNALDTFLSQLNPTESEEHTKTLLRDFLRAATFPPAQYYLNVAGKNDQVIRTGPTEVSPVGVLLEVKSPSNSGEMVKTSDLNRKAFHELLLYFMRHRAAGTGEDMKHLIITNGYEWFIFNATEINTLFWRDTAFRKSFEEHERGAKTDTRTENFYKKIAKPTIAETLDKHTLSFAHFDLQHPISESQSIFLAKVLSPVHLLNEPFEADANLLNRKFYEELLYLIGLEEIKDGNTRLIRRVAKPTRQDGSLLENTLTQLREKDLLQNLNDTELAVYGTDDDPLKQAEKQIEEIALELCLTWVNRLLFLKLLEGQLRRYHGPSELKFRFLAPRRNYEYDELERLFFSVLNRPVAERQARIRPAFDHIPYLNSSLFEPTTLERKLIFVSGLEDHLPLPLASHSVLPKLASGAPAHEALDYLLRFLDAYDFGGEGDALVQDDNKSLISASVLGLIFEKINGYRDGSFYTPGFITMYMASYVLRQKVLAHFNSKYGWDCPALEKLINYFKPAKLADYSSHFNTLRVCDPAVGSGHFLVSALNELLAIKSELGIILDDRDVRIEYSLEVANDELIVTRRDGISAFHYQATLAPNGITRTVSQEHTRVQAALFREKREIIEHSLFGVDLNSNSVRICRLRLWIELLKHAYYRPDTDFQELEVLPNLDINIKTGNSLISRFPLTEDLSEVFAQRGFTLEEYRKNTSGYFRTRSKAEKEKLQKFLNGIREQFRDVVHRRDPIRRNINNVKSALLRIELDSKPDLFGKTKLSEEEAWAQATVQRMNLARLEAEVATRENNPLYAQAFEWRFEFPELLAPDGSFRGFDAILGNPPYIRADAQVAEQRAFLRASNQYRTLHEKWDLYVPFLELGQRLLQPEGVMSMIVSDAFCHAKYATKSQQWFLDNTRLLRLDFFREMRVFKEAAVNSIIVTAEKASPDATTLPDRHLHLKRFDNLVVLPTAPQPNLNIRAFYAEEIDAQNNSMGAPEYSVPTLTLAEICYITAGIVGNSHEKKAKGEFILEDLLTNEEDSQHPQPYIEGKDLEHWGASNHRWIEWGTSRVPSLLRRPTFPELWRVEEKLIAADLSAGISKVKVAYDTQRLMHNNTIWSFIPWHSLTGVRNKSLKKVARYLSEHHLPQLMKREEIEVNSTRFSLYFILGICCSQWARDFLMANLRSKNHIYPDDWKMLPIPNVDANAQRQIVVKVEAILAAKASGGSHEALEAQLDSLVEKLYGVLILA